MLGTSFLFFPFAEATLELSPKLLKINHSTSPQTLPPSSHTSLSQFRSQDFHLLFFDRLKILLVQYLLTFAWEILQEDKALRTVLLLSRLNHKANDNLPIIRSSHQQSLGSGTNVLTCSCSNEFCVHRQEC